MVAARILQGAGAALMAPVGRLTVVRTFGKAELLRAMNFVIIPALIGPLLGPTAGGLIVHWLSWRKIFFVRRRKREPRAPGAGLTPRGPSVKTVKEELAPYSKEAQ